MIYFIRYREDEKRIGVNFFRKSFYLFVFKNFINVDYYCVLYFIGGFRRAIFLCYIVSD